MKQEEKQLRRGFLDQVQKFLAGDRVVVEATENGARSHNAVLLFDAAHHSAEMSALHYDADAFGLGVVHNGFGYLCRESFLHL